MVGDFRASGEIFASSVVQGGPPPSFLDQNAFETLVKNEVDILNLTPEKDLLRVRDNNIYRHRDTILEHGYTGLTDMAHSEDIVRSLTISLVNKRVLYLREFKEGWHCIVCQELSRIIQRSVSLYLCKGSSKMRMPHICSV